MHHPAFWTNLRYHLVMGAIQASWPVPTWWQRHPWYLLCYCHTCDCRCYLQFSMSPGHGKGPVSMSVTYQVVTLSAVTEEKSMWENLHWMAGIKPRYLAQKLSALSLDHHLHTSWQNVFLYYSIYLWKGSSVFIWEKCCKCWISTICRENLQNEEMWCFLLLEI